MADLGLDEGPVTWWTKDCFVEKVGGMGEGAFAGRGGEGDRVYRRSPSEGAGGTLFDGEDESNFSKLGNRSSKEGSRASSGFEVDADEGTGTGRGDDGFDEEGAKESPNPDEKELDHEAGELAPAPVFDASDAGGHLDDDFAEVAVETGRTGSRRSEKPSKGTEGEMGCGEFERGGLRSFIKEEEEGRKSGVAEDWEKEGLGWNLRDGS